MRLIKGYPVSLKEKEFHYCPGCTHGLAHRLIAEVLDELEIREEAIGVASVGCSVLAYEYFNCDMQQAAHGRAPAVATGIKRVHPDKVVFTYQGDGDLASIGLAELIHAANRGEKITVIFINNAIYGMTGGQMAPTTLPGQRTSTSPAGRSSSETGFPLKIAELLSTVEGVAYLARVSLHDPAHIVEGKRAIKTAFEYQLAGRGFSLVEILAACPTNWGMTPLKALVFVRDEMLKVYPKGVYRRLEK